MPKRVVVGNLGDTRRWMAFEDGKQYNGHTQHMDHVLEDVKRRAQAAPGRFSKKSDLQFRGTLSRVKIDQILRTLGKTWQDYAIDQDLKDAVRVIHEMEAPALTAKYWQT